MPVDRPIPLLILGEGPSLPTGLGRLTHDIAWLLSSMPEFKVGVLGRRGFNRSRYPWTNYTYVPTPECQWGHAYFEEAWNDLAGADNGIVLTLWDATRLLWLTHPLEMPASLQNLLGSGRIKKWAYCQVDSAGVDPGKLSAEQTAVLGAFDRVAIASKWGHMLAKSSFSHNDLDWMPHPINRTTFQPRDRKVGRSFWGIGDEPLIGCVMSNMARKDWPTVLEALSLLPGAKMWVRTDQAMGYWNLEALAHEYGVSDRILSDSKPLSDTELSHRYSACDATVVISGGEGFCYPVAESMSCGTPAVVGAYGAQAELVPEGCRVPPAYLRLDTAHNVRRAGYDGQMVAAALEYTIDAHRNGELPTVEMVEHLSMRKLGLVWKKWALKGIE